MSKTDIGTIQERFFYDNQEVVPRALLRQYASLNDNGSVNIYISIHKLAASATDEAISLDEDSNTQETWLWDTQGTDGQVITVKTNSDSDARAVKPLRVVSGALTALTASNSDSSSAVYLGIGRIVVSDTTNTEYREEEDL